jgi:hypothetical protein
VAETFEEYKNRILGYLGHRDPIRVQRLLPRGCVACSVACRAVCLRDAPLRASGPSLRSSHILQTRSWRWRGVYETCWQLPALAFLGGTNIFGHRSVITRTLHPTVPSPRSGRCERAISRSCVRCLGSVGGLPMVFTTSEGGKRSSSSSGWRPDTISITCYRSSVSWPLGRRWRANKGTEQTNGTPAENRNFRSIPQIT